MFAVVIAIIVLVIAYAFYRIPVPKESTDTLMIKLMLAAVKISTIKVIVELITFTETYLDSYIV